MTPSSQNNALDFSLAERMQGVAESATLKMAAATRALAAKGISVINFAAGEPDFPVPFVINEAVMKAVSDGKNKYTAVPGLPELRARIAKKFKDENGLAYTSDDVVVSSGAKQAIFNFLLAVISPGDEVLIPSPYWVSYPEMVRLAGGTPIVLKTNAATSYKLTVEQLKKSIGPRTKVLILNSPSNPCGIVYSKSELTAFAMALEGTKVLVCSDEIYEKLIFNGEFCSFGSVSEDAFLRTVTVNGFSKAYSMTGWRLGYAAGPRKILQAMSILQGQSTSGAASIVQYGGLRALDIPSADFTPLQAAFKRRLAAMIGIIQKESRKQLSFITPGGAFYLFLNVEAALGQKYNNIEGQEVIVRTTDDLAMYLLNTAHVGTVAGSGFGHPEFLRLSFAVSDEDVAEGTRRVVRAINELH